MTMKNLNAYFDQHVRKLEFVALNNKDEDRRLDAVKSLAAFYLLKAGDLDVRT